jgi:hypothetical protein
MHATGLAAWSLGLALLTGTVGSVAPVGVSMARQATPAATPIVIEPTAPAPAPTAAPAGPPLPEPTADAAATQTDVVTLAAWYATDPSGEFINVLPLATDPASVVGPQPGAASIGRAEFPEEGVPTILLGDSNFDSYARSEGDIPERWTWFDDTEGARPATLVLQVSGLDGAYQGYFGTATFVSRDDAAGGVLILALRPPTPAGAEAATEEDAATEDTTEAEVDASAVDAGAAQPDPAIEPPTDEAAAPGA